MNETIIKHVLEVWKKILELFHVKLTKTHKCESFHALKDRERAFNFLSVKDLPENFLRNPCGLFCRICLADTNEKLHYFI